MSKPLFLFDVDGTLLTNSAPAHLQATAAAIKEVFGFEVIESERDGAHYFGEHHIDGFTIAEIFRLALSDFEVDTQTVSNALPELAKVSAVQYGELLNNGGHPGDLLIGVDETLFSLKTKGAIMGLLTGGTRELVEIKLEACDLDGLFTFGGFGDTAFDRSDLFPEAMADFARVHPESTDQSTVIYVGDTITDVTAGQKNGAIVVGVATGFYSVDELSAAGADYAFKNLAAAQPTLMKLHAGVA